MSTSDPTNPSTEHPAAHDDPDALRAEIERTRARLSNDVDTLGETADPRNVARRQGAKVKRAAGHVKDKVMGTSAQAGQDVRERGQEVGDAVSGAASDAAQAVREAPGAAKAQTQGNPLAAGLIAFGAGLLIAGLIPSSRREQQAVSDLGERLQPVAENAQQAAREVADNLREPAQEAAESVKESAGQAAQTVKDEGRSAAHDVRDQAESSRDTVQQSRDR